MVGKVSAGGDDLWQVELDITRHDEIWWECSIHKYDVYGTRFF